MSISVIIWSIPVGSTGTGKGVTPVITVGVSIIAPIIWGFIGQGFIIIWHIASCVYIIQRTLGYFLLIRMAMMAAPTIMSTHITCHMRSAGIKGLINPHTIAATQASMIPAANNKMKRANIYASIKIGSEPHTTRSHVRRLFYAETGEGEWEDPTPYVQSTVSARSWRWDYTTKSFAVTGLMW
jgi:hypothetical protein